MPEKLASMHESALVLHLAFPQAELCERLRIAVEQAASSNADSMEALRLTVCEFASALRDKGATPAGVRFFDTVYSARFRLPKATDGLRQNRQHELLSHQVVQWE